MVRTAHFRSHEVFRGDLIPYSLKNAQLSLDFFDKLMSVLSPVIYGLAFAYLLAPIVDFFDRYIQKGLPKVKSSLVRGLSILVTWICVIALIYLMFSILIPELVDSTKTLADNFESYYKTVYNWVNSLVENQAIFSDDIYSDQLLSALNGYYDKLVKWVTDTVIPQAQVAIVAVTGGIWSVVIFLKNLLIGMMISVYLLARKESFAKQSKKILFAILPETPYRRTLRAVAEADRIFSGFVRGKLLDSLIIGILCFICCSIFKFPYTPIISVFVGVTNIIPIFGPFLGAVPCLLLILLIDPLQALYFLIFVVLLQQFDGNFLGPKILGETTGVSSFLIIISILIGGGFWGVFGMIIAVPVCAIICTVCRNFANRRLEKHHLPDDDAFYFHMDHIDPETRQAIPYQKKKIDEAEVFHFPGYRLRKALTKLATEESSVDAPYTPAKPSTEEKNSDSSDSDQK